MKSDPLGLAAGINTYGYTLNSPLKYIEPTGLMSVEYYLKTWICGFQDWNQAYWESVAYTDFLWSIIGVTDKFSGNPGQCSCNNGGG